MQTFAAIEKEKKKNENSLFFSKSNKVNSKLQVVVIISKLHFAAAAVAIKRNRDAIKRNRDAIKRIKI